MALRLTPQHQLRWIPSSTKLSAKLQALRDSFVDDWRQGLFQLAAHKQEFATASTLRYWRRVGHEFLTALSHVPEQQEQFEIEEPSFATLSQWLLAAPPMEGGEYLTLDGLLQIWQALHAWYEEVQAEYESLGDFLASEAPSWRQVGRVCFHLAENPKDGLRPFAFLVTYASGMNTDGALRYLPLRRALEEYAGTKNRARLSHLLMPIQEAAKRHDWVRRLLVSSKIYQASAWTVPQAYRMLKSVATLEKSGIVVRLPNWWRQRKRAQVDISVDHLSKNRFSADKLLSFDVGVAIGEERLSPEEITELLASKENLVFLRGQWVEVDHEKLQQALAHWREVRRESQDGELSFIEGMRLLAGTTPDLQDDDMPEEYRVWVSIRPGQALQQTLQQLRDPAQREALTAPKQLQATLRHYQADGVSWLHLLTRLGLGACLADDMGLGKTIQLLTLLLHEQQQSSSKRKKRKQPSLLVLPASLLGNWKHEAERFTPSLRLLILHSSETSKASIDAIAKAPKKSLQDVDVVVTTYGMLARQTWLTDFRWHLAILDEAQAIKNAKTRQSTAARKLQAHTKIALTGTPVENRLSDLWSIFDFINPGLLGSAGEFKEFTRQLKDRDQDQYAPLRRLIAPYILRRMKTDPNIVPDLPDKTETNQYCFLTKAQAKLYAQVVKELEQELKATDEIKRRGVVLNALMRLKQICNHPSQCLGDGDYQPKHSGKFQRLAELCQEFALRQEKVLIFTQFRAIIPYLEEYLSSVFGSHGLMLHGGTKIKDRKKLVQQFQDADGPPFFLLSLKAGGTGLNLTAANHVVHFDRWWNPAVENQATDRAFRIGQQKNVMVHKFVTTGTLEEEIDKLLSDKRQLAESLLSQEDELKLTEMDDEALLSLVRLDIKRATL